MLLEKFQKFTQNEKDTNVTPTDLYFSLRNLTKILFKFHKKKVIILIDEYDKPLNDAFNRGGTKSPLFIETSQLINGILCSALKGTDKYLEKGILFGIFQLTKGESNSGLNNVTVFGINEPVFSEFFGFSEEEILKIAKRLCINCTEEFIKNLREWYNGYNLVGLTMYNPFSVMNYLKTFEITKTPKNYWKDSGKNQIIINLLKEADAEILKTLNRLMVEKNGIKLKIDVSVDYESVQPNYIWNILFHSGYLTFADKENQFLKIPNAEVFEIFEENIKNFMNSEDFNSFINSLINGKMQDFENYLQAYLLHTFSYFDVGGKNNEKSYHAFLLGLIACLHKSYNIESNREGNSLGRFDIKMEPNENLEIWWAIIIELKSIGEDDNLDKSAKEAIEQIKKKQYYNDIEKFEKKLLIGIAFRGKELKLNSEYMTEKKLPEHHTLKKVKTEVSTQDISPMPIKETFPKKETSPQKKSHPKQETLPQKEALAKKDSPKKNFKMKPDWELLFRKFEKK